MMDTMLSALRAGLPELGVTIPEGADEKLCQFGCELVEQKFDPFDESQVDLGGLVNAKAPEASEEGSGE